MTNHSQPTKPLNAMTQSKAIITKQQPSQKINQSSNQIKNTPEKKFSQVTCPKTINHPTKTVHN